MELVYLDLDFLEKMDGVTTLKSLMCFMVVEALLGMSDLSLDVISGDLDEFFSWQCFHWISPFLMTIVPTLKKSLMLHPLMT